MDHAVVVANMGVLIRYSTLDAMQRTVQRALRRGEESNLTRRILNREYFSSQMLVEEAQRGDSVAPKSL